MTRLPIRLVLTEVVLIGPRNNETGIRWTLGPGWYEDHQFDDGPLPYYGYGGRSVEPVTDAPEIVKTWAAQTIARTTDYRVTSWNGLTPNLEIQRHTVEIWTLASVRASYTVPSTQAHSIIRSLGNPDEIIVIPRPEGVTTHIPVRAVAAVNHTVTWSPITNG